MEHIASDIQVFVTNDYSFFRRLRGNRALNEGKIKKMVRDIRHGINFLPDFPIVAHGLNGHLDIIDGQHRFEAARRTGQPVYYIIRREQVALDKVARLNSLQEKWKPADFLRCYIEQGLKSYCQLQAFQEKYRFPLSVALNLLYHGVTGSEGGAGDDLMALFHRGTYEVKHLRAAEEIAGACHRFSAFPGWNTRSFVIAVSKVLSADVCDLEELVRKFSQDPGQLQKQVTYKDYLANLEQIFNKGLRIRRTIY
ncbi:ParB N-terminal domain-containing protein [Paraflavisolibacter sp. H34]|uniref:ParB N-terminal domain-containing protein n=1 Tax=Huijunlia imazamoxiresistens TaxID=3127457 RepID=UPI003019BA69